MDPPRFGTPALGEHHRHPDEARGPELHHHGEQDAHRILLLLLLLRCMLSDQRRCFFCFIKVIRKVIRKQKFQAF